MGCIFYSVEPIITRELPCTGSRKNNVFQVGGLVGKNLRNLEKIK
jgi:hypothetical protein